MIEFRVWKLVGRRALVGLVLACTLALGACGREPAPTPQASGDSAPKILRRGNAAEIDSLDPVLAVLNESGNVLRDTYEGLAVIGPDLYPVPGTAERWEVSEDGRRYTFHLRATARWSNEQPVTAEDFVLSWRRLLDPATGSPHAKLLAPVQNAAEITSGAAKPSALGVLAPDPRTLVVTLTRRAPNFLSDLTHWALSPTYRGTAPGRPEEAITNGPFTPVRWTVGVEVEVARNRAYWNDAATRLDGVRYIHFANNSDEYTRFRAGELDVTQNLPVKSLDELRQAHGDAVRISPSLGVYYYGFNLDDPRFRSRELRQALSMAVDRERLVATVTRLGELPAYSWVPDGIRGYVPVRPEWATWPYARRVEEARRLYARAGYSAKKPLRFELRYNTGSAHENIALAVAAMWKEALGVEARPVGEEFKSLLQTIQAGGAPMFRSSWTITYADPYLFLETFESSYHLNLPRYRNPDYDADLATATEALDPTVRAAALTKAERRLAEDAPVIPLYFMVNRRLVGAHVNGWRDTPVRVVYSAGVSLER